LGSKLIPFPIKNATVEERGDHGGIAPTVVVIFVNAIIKNRVFSRTIKKTGFSHESYSGFLLNRPHMLW